MSEHPFGLIFEEDTREKQISKPKHKKRSKLFSEDLVHPMDTKNPKAFQNMLKRQTVPLDLLIAELEANILKDAEQSDEANSQYSSDAFSPGKFINHYQYKKKKKKVKNDLLLPDSSYSDSPKKAKLSKPSKEVSKISELANLVRVPEEQLDTFMNKYEGTTAKVAGSFLADIAPVFLAFENAMSYSTVAMRDGLSFDNEIDLEIMPLLEWSTRICTFELFLKELPLSEAYRELLLKNVIFKAVDRCFSEKKKPLLGYADSDNRVAGVVTSMNKEKAEKAIQGLKDLANKASTRYGTIAPKKIVRETTVQTLPGSIKRKDRSKR